MNYTENIKIKFCNKKSKIIYTKEYEDCPIYNKEVILYIDISIKYLQRNLFVEYNKYNKLDNFIEDILLNEVSPNITGLEINIYKNKYKIEFYTYYNNFKFTLKKNNYTFNELYKKIKREIKNCN